MFVKCQILCTYAGNHTLASVRGPEDYEFLKACFAPVWEELQDLVTNPHVKAHGSDVQLNIVFGADYKVSCYNVLANVYIWITNTCSSWPS